MLDSQRMIELLKPTGRKRLMESKPLSGMVNLENSTIGFLDNSKPNFAIFLDRLETLLLSNYQVARIVRKQKQQPSFLAADIIIDDLTRNCDLVITGSCD